MKKSILLLFILLGLSTSASAQLFGQRGAKTINVVPDNAKIILNGA
ncbi:MAG: hypothetical protein IJ942_02305 [Alistipes sp.]|nr:hypothetical protein [Alistipes sp.]